MIDGGGLGPEARALLDLARDQLAPDPAAIARVRGKLGITAGAAAGTAIGIKLLVLATVLAAAAGAGLALRRDRVAAVVPAIDVAALDRATPEPVAPPQAASPAYELAPPAPIVHPVARPQAIIAPAEPASLAREVELIDLAMALLRSHRPDDALRAVHRHAVETFDRGQLAEDAAAIEIEAMCQLHTATADKLAAFDARFPRSAQRARLTPPCPGSSP